MAEISGALQSNPDVPVINLGGVVSAASSAPMVSPSPGELVSIYGARLADGVQSAEGLPLPTQLKGSSLIAAGKPLPLFFASDGQINAIVPYNLTPGTTVQLVAQRGNRLSVPETVTIRPSAPAVFTVNQSGKGQGHVYVIPGPGEQILADSRRPVKPGDVLVIYCTGLGPVEPPLDAGSITPSDLLRPAINVVGVSIGGQMAKVFFAGLTPGFAALYQINAIAPDGMPSGDQIPVVISAGGVTGPPVTIAVQ